MLLRELISELRGYIDVALLDGRLKHLFDEFDQESKLIFVQASLITRVLKFWKLAGRCARARCCVSNYYFSAQLPVGREYSNVTSFSAPPSQRVLRIWSKLDSLARQTLRVFVPGGIGKKDIFEGSKIEK